MIELNVNEYYKVLKPLQSVNINTLFAKAVICKQVPGAVYVDDEKEPTVFYIAHPYGMSLLFGNANNEKFNKNLYCYLTNENKVRNKHEWLQVFPNTWSDTIKTVLGSKLVTKDVIASQSINTDDICGKVVENTRVNFAFNIIEYNNWIKNADVQEYEIVHTTKEMFQKIKGSVTPEYFWRDEEQFADSGIGYSLLFDGEIASTAFSAFRHENQLEIGIETLEKYRAKGFAWHVCSALIDYCIENGLEPVWACRLENIGSYNLAKKLGFVPSLHIPYYRLAI